MESINVPTKVSFEILLQVLNERMLNPDDHYRNVYIIQLMQRLQIMIHQDKRRLTRL